MLSDLHPSLRGWLAAALPAGTEVVFDSPAALARRSGRRAVLGLFLHDVREDPSGLAAAGYRVRGQDGRIAATVLPTPRYRLSYVVTAWAGEEEAELRLLDAVLCAHAGQQVVPAEFLMGTLRAQEIPAQFGPPADASVLPAVWQAATVPMRTCLELAVLAPAAPPRVLDPAPPAEAIELSVRPHPEPTPPPTTSRRRWERANVTEHQSREGDPT